MACFGKAKVIFGVEVKLNKIASGFGMAKAICLERFGNWRVIPLISAFQDSLLSKAPPSLPNTSIAATTSTATWLNSNHESTAAPVRTRTASVSTTITGSRLASRLWERPLFWRHPSSSLCQVTRLNLLPSASTAPRPHGKQLCLTHGANKEPREEDTSEFQIFSCSGGAGATTDHERTNIQDKDRSK